MRRLSGGALALFAAGVLAIGAVVAGVLIVKSHSLSSSTHDTLAHKPRAAERARHPSSATPRAPATATNAAPPASNRAKTRLIADLGDKSTVVERGSPTYYQNLEAERPGRITNPRAEVRLVEFLNYSAQLKITVADIDAGLPGLRQYAAADATNGKRFTELAAQSANATVDPSLAPPDLRPLVAQWNQYASDVHAIELSRSQNMSTFERGDKAVIDLALAVRRALEHVPGAHHRLSAAINAERAATSAARDALRGTTDGLLGQQLSAAVASLTHLSIADRAASELVGTIQRRYPRSFFAKEMRKLSRA